jgi:hypothetical protein
MPERPAPLVLVVDPAPLAREAAPGSYLATVLAGQSLLAAELSRRLAAQGAAVVRLPAKRMPDFAWGAWFTTAARSAMPEGAVDAVGYAGAGALALLADDDLDALLSPIPGEVAANNRFSADAFVVAGDIDAALTALEPAGTDNGAVRLLEEAGFRSRDVSSAPFSRFDVDTPLDLALLRLASRLPATRRLDARLSGFLEMVRLPGGRGLEVPQLGPLAEVIRDREGELVVAGRVPSAVWQLVERDTACRVRLFVEERGMRSARDGTPRSLLAHWLTEHGPAALIGELSRLGEAIILDTRVLMAALAGSSQASAWPPDEERFAADFGDASRVTTPWLRELVAAAAAAPVPVLMGGHALVSDGLRLIVEAAWLGR